MSQSEPQADRPSQPPRPEAHPQADEHTRLTDNPGWTEAPFTTPPPTSFPPPSGTGGNTAGETPVLPQGLQARYRPIRVLGSGGFANVYLAHDSVLDQPVAIKILRLGLASPNDRDRFLLEARIGAKLRHPNIATVFDIIQTADGLQMVMEYYPGGTLTERLRARGPLHMREAIDITRQVAQALAYAHRHGVIHRDVKPANIFLAGEGMVKLGDFGIATHSDRHEFTQTGMIIGTPLYMPPEQGADSRDVDPRTDIYALGLTLYHMLTGRPPRVVDLESIPETFRMLIRQSTAPERADRLVSAEQFIAMLDQIRLRPTSVPTAPDEDTQTGQAAEASLPPSAVTHTPTPPTSTPPVPAPQPVPPRPRHHGWLWGSTAVLGAAILGAALYAFVFQDFLDSGISPPPPAPTAAPTPVNRKTPDDSGRLRPMQSVERPRLREDRRSLPPALNRQGPNTPFPRPDQRLRERPPQQRPSLPPVAITAAPTPTPPPTPNSTPAQDPLALLERAYLQYLDGQPGIAAAIEILRDSNTVGKAQAMRAFEVRQARMTLVDAAEKNPGDAMINLIVGMMLEKGASSPEMSQQARQYLLKAIALDQRTGSPLQLSLESIRGFQTRAAAGAPRRP